MKMSWRAAVVGIVGIIFPLIQNELIYQKTDPHAPLVEILKALNTAFTIVLLYCIFKLYHIKVLFARCAARTRHALPPQCVAMVHGGLILSELETRGTAWPAE